MLTAKTFDVWSGPAGVAPVKVILDLYLRGKFQTKIV
jgi:hypothetical protein